MTKRELDWADEEVNRLLYTPTVTNIEYSAMLAQALRSAHRRGMEEAAGMVEAKTQEYRDEAHDQKQWGNRVAENGALVGARALKNMAAAIRAAIKNEEQPQEPPT